MLIAKWCCRLKNRFKLSSSGIELDTRISISQTFRQWHTPFVCRGYAQHAFMHLIKNANRNKQPDFKSKPFCSHVCRRIRVKNSGSIEIEIESELNDLFVEEDPQQATSSSNISSKGVKSLNPWVLKCHQRQLSKLKRSATVPQQQKEPVCQSMLLNPIWILERTGILISCTPFNYYRISLIGKHYMEVFLLSIFLKIYVWFNVFICILDSNIHAFSI